MAHKTGFTLAHFGLCFVLLMFFVVVVMFRMFSDVAKGSLYVYRAAVEAGA